MTNMGLTNSCHLLSLFSYLVFGGVSSHECQRIAFLYGMTQKSPEKKENEE